MATEAIDLGRARMISKKDTLQLLALAEKDGLALQPNNSLEEFWYLLLLRRLLCSPQSPECVSKPIRICGIKLLFHHRPRKVHRLWGMFDAVSNASDSERQRQVPR